MKGAWILESSLGRELHVNHERLFGLDLDCIKPMRFGDFMCYNNYRDLK